MSYKFHSDWFKLSAANFRGAVKDRYPKIKKKELDALVEEHYGIEILEDDGEPIAIPSESSEDIE
jgi:porphobilinogen deaminase